MGSDLSLANRVFFLTKELAKEMHKIDEHIDYYTAVMVVVVLLQNVQLAKEIVEATWEGGTEDQW